MGAWGYRALESDAGLDVVDYLQDHIPPDKTLSLPQVINALKTGGFFGGDFDDIDFLYDNSAMALAELFLMFAETGEMDYDDDEDAEKSLRGITRFTADEPSLRFLLRYLTDIRDEVPDDDGERETVELWRDSDCWEDWRAHLNELIAELEAKRKQLAK